MNETTAEREGRTVPGQAPGQGRPDIETGVIERYARGAERVEPGLCCPTSEYDLALLRAVPTEIVERDYGCGNPARHVAAGETVVDLGSGAGKACYVLAQTVGPMGRVIGVDFNDAMLRLSRKHLDPFGQATGLRNLRFVKGRIQDLALDLERTQAWLDDHPVGSLDDLSRFDAERERWRREDPLVPDGCADVVVSNCVLNLVRPAEKHRVFAEIHRVLRVGGRAVISDIVCDEEPSEAMRNDPDLWSGCLSGALREDAFVDAFAAAGFAGIEILSRQAEPWRAIGDIEFRAMTVRAFKPESGLCLECGQAVVYRGPWAEVRDDEGHVLRRGRRMAVCDRTYRRLTDPEGPYAGELFAVPPARPTPLDQAEPFTLGTGAERDSAAGRSHASDPSPAPAAGTCTRPGCC